MDFAFLRMRVALIILFVVCSLLLRAQQKSTLELRKNAGYRVFMLLPEIDSVVMNGQKVKRSEIVRMSNGQTVEKIKVLSAVYFAEIRYLFGTKDTTLTVEIDVQRDTVINLDKFIELDAFMLEEVDITDAGSVFSKFNLKQVDGFSIYAGKKTEVINLATTKANDRKSTRLNSSHSDRSRMPSSA